MVWYTSAVTIKEIRDSELVRDISEFSREFGAYSAKSIVRGSIKMDARKGLVVASLYRRRGKYAKRLMHSGMAGIAALGVMIAPMVAQEFPGEGVDPWSVTSAGVLSLTSASDQTETIIADRQFRDSVIHYTVEEGDTVSTIADKYGVSVDTIRWQNDLPSRDSIKVGQELEILPVTGVLHTVRKGDTVYSIAKKYDIDAQAIVNYPFNTYTNDETFELAIGQNVIVPDGVEPEAVLWSPTARIRQITPNAGTVVASGNFVWPANGTISTHFVWYHPGIDIANRAMPNVLAADSGTVIVAGWPDNYGYGNRIVIDHGNGTRTLYAHLNRIYVVAGQSVNRGDAIGQMGSTGRSTGPHLHFEVTRNGVKVNPLGVLN
jgi:murein DD-endopeptidase MepM/ murein hydrolase activator NlpD